MACVVVPFVEAVGISVAEKALAKRTVEGGIARDFVEKISVLKNMLYGGSLLLAVEHIYHGEISFIPPFLTAARNPAEIPAMLREMATVGVAMALLTTAVWAGYVALSRVFRRRGNAGIARCA
ncbi:MAG: hypothetical protein J1E32_06410 [Treponema sp.]|nr:hypothetical protein [Treponema sp.]